MRTLLVFLALLGALSVAHAAPIVYSTDTSSDALTTFDLATGAGSVIGALDPTREGTGQFQDNRYATPISLAINPLDNQIWVRNNTMSVNSTGLQSTGDLLTVDITTGAATLVTTGSSVLAIAFAPDGTLYGITSDRFLPVVTIDLTTGATTSTGLLFRDFGFGIAIDPTGKFMYGLAGSTLSVLDLTTGAKSTVGTVTPPFGIPGAIEFDPATGILWGAAFGGSTGSTFFHINASTAAASNFVQITGPVFSSQGFGFLSNTTPDPDPVPEPASLALASVALAFAAIKRRRRRG